MVKDSQVYDTNGNVMYPIDPRKAMVLDLLSVNNGVAYTDNKVNVSIFSYNKAWGSSDCQWQKLDTFGLLNNIDGCDCPLQTSDLDLKLPLDLSAFSVIVNTLASNIYICTSEVGHTHNDVDAKFGNLAKALKRDQVYTPQAWPLMVKDSQVYDIDGNVMYPIDPRKAMLLDLLSVNNGVAYADNKVNVSIFSYNKAWGSSDCQWQKLDTFGLLNNIDGCDFAHNCPLQTGDLDLKLPLDLSAFSVIVNTLASNKPYQLEVRMYDFNQGSGHEEIACVVAQICFSEGN